MDDTKFRRRRYRYIVPEQCEESEYEFDSNLPDCYADSIAAEAADDFHSAHDGWEATWPLTFIIKDASGKHLGTFNVSREMVQTFHANWIK